MDNLTHTLIGLTAGEALALTTPVSKHGLAPETRRGMFLAATIIGGNLPDLDLLYSYRGPSTDKLTYMLEHRGYTHASFIVAGHIAAQRVESIARAEFPSARTIDHVLTPMPEDPLCWDVLLLQTMGDRYISRHAILALAPALIPANRCGGFSIDRQTLPPQTAPGIKDAAAIHWQEFSMSKTTLAALVASSCDAAALMRFARAPFGITAGTAGHEWLMGDLRFARGPKRGFSDILIDEDAMGRRRCPWTPPWEPPRADLFGSAYLRE